MFSKKVKKVLFEKHQIAKSTKNHSTDVLHVYSMYKLHDGKIFY